MKPFRVAVAVLLFSIAGMAVSAPTAWATSPPNDDFANATQLSGRFQIVDANTISSGVEAGEPAHLYSTSNMSVWFKWTAPADGAVIIQSCSNENTFYAQAYIGTGVNSLSAVTDGFCRSSFEAVGGTEYHIAVYPSSAGDSGFFRFSLSERTRPANDDFASARLLTGNSAAVAGSTAGASLETGEPAHHASSNPHSVWYKWVAPGSGFVSYDICKSDFDTATAVYTGSAVNALTPVNDSDCGKQFQVNSGTAYFLAVAPDATSYAGDFYLALNYVQSAPANDNFANAQVIAPAGGEFAGTTGGASAESGESSVGGASATVWYSWTAPQTGTALLNLCPESNVLGFSINLYYGDSIGGLSYFTGGGCQISFPAVSGTTYRIQITAGNESDAGNFDLKLSQPAAPANDNFTNAIQVNSQTYEGGGTFTGASREGGENDPGGNSTGTVWYYWTAPSPNQVTVDTCGSNFDTYLAVFQGATFPLALLGSNDDSGGDACGLRSSYTFVPTQGQTYRIAVSAFSSYGSGDYKLRIYQGPLVPLKYTVAAAKQGTGSGTVYMQGYERIRCGDVCSQEFNDGAFVQMFAVPDEGSEFAGWKNEPACPGQTNCQMNLTGSETFTAVFTDMLHKTLTVKKNGSGKGTVSSNVTGIKCGATCSHVYDTGTVVKLTPKPAAGSKFTGWAGACTGVKGNTCKLVMNDELNAVATFSKVTLKLKTGKAKLNLKKGTATLSVTVNTAAKIMLSGKNIGKRTASTKGAKTVKLPVIAKGKLRKTLRRRGKAAITVKITAKPAGSGKTVTKTVKVVLKVKEKGR